MTSDPPDSLYTDPKIYDILYTPDTWREVDALERVEREFERRAGRDLARDRTWLERPAGPDATSEWPPVEEEKL